MDAVLDFQFRDAPLSPVFVGLEDGLDIRPSVVSSDMDLFKYFLNEDEIEATSSETGSPSYDSLSSPPPIPSPPTEFGTPQSSPTPNSLPSPVHTVNIPELLSIKSEPSEFDGAFEKNVEKKRKIKDEGSPLPVHIVPKNMDASHFVAQSHLPEEDRHLKRQRRLIKNRESAQLSRMRKKMYIDDLEKKVTALTQDNEALTKKVASLVHDKNTLSEQVNHLQILLKQQNQRRTTTVATTNKNLKTAGVCMLMILFSFGLFFNIKGGERYREQYHVGRMLASVEEDQIPTVPVPTTSGASISSSSSSSSLEQKAMIPKRKRSSEEEQLEPKSAVVRKKDDAPVAPRRKVIKIQNIHEHSHSKKEEVEPADGLVPVSHQAPVPAPVDVSSIPQLSQSIVRRPDTNYIYCSEPQNVFADSTRRDSQGRVINQPLISLLMPANNLNATFNARGYDNDDHTLLEVTCQIMNINVYPAIPLSNNSQTVS